MSSQQSIIGVERINGHVCPQLLAIGSTEFRRKGNTAAAALRTHQYVAEKLARFAFAQLGRFADHVVDLRAKHGGEAAIDKGSYVSGIDDPDALFGTFQ